MQLIRRVCTQHNIHSIVHDPTNACTSDVTTSHLTGILMCTTAYYMFATREYTYNIHARTCANTTYTYTYLLGVGGGGRRGSLGQGAGSIIVFVLTPAGTGGLGGVPRCASKVLRW